VCRSSHHRPGPATTIPPGEAGISLVFTLVFIIIVFTALTGVLGYAFAASRAAESYERDRAFHFSADAAMEAGVQMVKTNSTLGVTLFPTCSFTYDLAPHNAGQVFTSGAHLTVDCLPTPNNPSPPPGPGPNGEQAYRDVTFEVTCRLPLGYDPTAPLECGSGPEVVFLGQARVRFDIDPGFTPRTAWAIVPKVISWKIAR